MQIVSHAIDESPVSQTDRLKDFALALAMLIVAGALFALLFNKETVLSHSIGYNLYGAERILDGEVPYRDFHTLYPPATVYLNAAVFKFLGISLWNALFVVAIFKALTTLMIYLCGRRMMPRGWALASAAFSLFWLRPNGPFKAVPMHYGALFLALALCLLIDYHRRHKSVYLFAAGIALGLLALFKHNIGGYALIGSMAIILLEGKEGRFALANSMRNYRRAIMLGAGCALPVLPVLAYMQAKDALAPMIKTLLFGPGEFLISRLTALPSPLIPLLVAFILAACAFASHRLKTNQRIGRIAWMLALVSLLAFLMITNQDLIDGLIFYEPVAIIAGGLLAGAFGHKLRITERPALLSVTVMAAAAFMESFPRFAREQSVAAMPFIALLLICLLHKLQPAIAKLLGEGLQSKAALVVLPMTLLIMESRLFFDTYFDASLRFKSDTELQTERGRGVYFPKAKADEIDSVTGYIQRRVPAGGYFFAQSYAGSSYLFLADRNNPSGAQFWGGVGVTDAERAETLKAIENKQVRFIITSRKDLDAEKYQPMRDYINAHFKQSEEIGETLILER